MDNAAQIVNQLIEAMSQQHALVQKHFEQVQKQGEHVDKILNHHHRMIETMGTLTRLVRRLGRQTCRLRESLERFRGPDEGEWWKGR